jgi:hypothetical protein
MWGFRSAEVIVMDNDHYRLPSDLAHLKHPVIRSGEGRYSLRHGVSFNICLLRGSKDNHVWILLTPDFVWNQDRAADMKQIPSLSLMRIIRHSGRFRRLSGTVVTIYIYIYIYIFFVVLLLHFYNLLYKLSNKQICYKETLVCGAIIQWWFSYVYCTLCCAEQSSNDDSPIYTAHYVVRSDHPVILLYMLCIMLCGAIIQWFSYIYCALCCAERSSNDDSPMYTVHFVVCASTLLPLSGPSSQTAVAVLVCV